MGTSRWLVLAGLLMGGIAVAAQEKTADEKTKSADGADPTKVEVLFSKEHVPDSVKVRAKVDLRLVSGQTVMGNGRMLVNSKVIVPGLEVLAVTKMDKPKSPDEAVKVELKGTKEQIEKVIKFKDQKVRVVERTPGGAVESKEKRVVLRLEPVASDSKKIDGGKKGEGKKAVQKPA